MKTLKNQAKRTRQARGRKQPAVPWNLYLGIIPSDLYESRLGLAAAKQAVRKTHGRKDPTGSWLVGALRAAMGKLATQ